MKKETDLQLFHLESIGDDYIKTLEAWRHQFLNNDQIKIATT